MQVSCKVSYSVLVEIERQGLQLDAFFESIDTPTELLKDPSCWLSVDKMETFLSDLGKFVQVRDPGAFYREVGQKNIELRAWGVLDSVLKMVESPKDIFAQPDRFLSYFLTPPPEFQTLKQDDHKITFSFFEAPTAKLISAYLMGAVEGLPNYMGTPPAVIETIDEKNFQITWHDDQQSLFDETEKKRRQFHPEIVHSVLASIKGQAGETSNLVDPETGAPENMTNEAFEKMVALEVEKRMGVWASQQQEVDETFFKIKNDFYKMYDYYTRAQQIVTLIGPTARQASVREAMRRVDWEHVQKEFPKMVESACDSILSLKDTFRKSLVSEPVVDAPVSEPVDLNELIDRVVEELSLGTRSIKIDKRLSVDRKVAVDPVSFSRALTDILNVSVLKSAREGELKIISRPVGSKVQIEISDNSHGFTGDHLEKIFSSEEENNLNHSQSIIEQHQGNISISSRRGEGSTFLIELPL